MNLQEDVHICKLENEQTFTLETINCEWEKENQVFNF